MKRLILVCVMILCLLPVEGWAEFDYETNNYEVSEEELTAVAEADFPEWTVAEDSRYWTGRWHN